LSGNGFENNQLYQVEKCLIEGCYRFIIFDLFGDGICCTYGSGYYLVDLDGVRVGEGNQFGSNESVDFCVGNPL